jgi:CRP-like cAMP-binding protein
LFTHHVTWIEVIGYIAAACTLATYSMKTMIPLRTAGMTANVLFIAYGYFGAIYPTLALHLVLLALNATRLHQMLALVKKVREATHGDLSMDWLKPFMTPRRYCAGDVLFRQGDKADEIFFVVSGRLRLREIEQDIPAGQVFGELGLLQNIRAFTCECIEDSELLAISYASVKQLYFQNPTFGFYFLRVVAERLMANNRHLAKELERMCTCAAVPVPHLPHPSVAS